MWRHHHHHLTRLSPLLSNDLTTSRMRLLHRLHRIRLAQWKLSSRLNLRLSKGKTTSTIRRRHHLRHTRPTLWKSFIRRKLHTPRDQTTSIAHLLHRLHHTRQGLWKLCKTLGQHRLRRGRLAGRPLIIRSSDNHGTAQRMWSKLSKRNPSTHPCLHAGRTLFSANPSLTRKYDTTSSSLHRSLTVTPSPSMDNSTVTSKTIMQTTTSRTHSHSSTSNPTSS